MLECLIRVHGREPLILLAFEFGIFPKAENGLRSERCFVRLLDTIAEPPRVLVSMETEEVWTRESKHQWEQISINFLQELLVLFWRVV